MSKLNTTKHSEGGEDHGGWLQSLADLLSLLLCFFIVMYSISEKNKKKFDEIKEAVSTSFKGGQNPSEENIITKSLAAIESKEARALYMVATLLGLGDKEASIKKIEEVYNKEKSKEKIASFLKNEISSHPGALKFKDSKDNEIFVNLSLPESILFASNSSELQKNSFKILDSIIGTMKKMDQIVSIEIRGHADSISGKNAQGIKTNLELSARRSAAVAGYFLQSGIDRKVIKISGIGDLEPLFPEVVNGKINSDNMTKNRRVEIVIKRKNAS